MVNYDLVDYIEEYMDDYSIDQLEDSLLEQGYSQREVEEAIDIALNEKSPQHPRKPQAPQGPQGGQSRSRRNRGSRQRRQQRRGGSSVEPNTAAALSYLAGILTGVIFLMIDKRRFVKFHAMQSIITFGVFGAFWPLSTFITAFDPLGLFSILALIAIPLLGLIQLVLWILLMVKAYQGQKFMLPIIGGLAEKFI